MRIPRVTIRRSLLSIGRRLPSRTVADLRSALGYLELGGWLVNQPGAPKPPVFRTREALFAHALSHLRGSRKLYLEFGVYEGASLRWWAENLTDPDARLVGFDSFEGLPEDWRPGHKAGHFRTASPPCIDDPRVSFEVGWFDDTLADYKPPEHDQLIINVDCDLYSSARTVLEWLEPHVEAGTLVYFDELPDRDHEMRAFFESLAASGRRVTPLGVGGGGLHWLFRYQ